MSSAKEIMDARREATDQGYCRVMIVGETNESVWCRPVPGRPNHYTVENIPFMSDACCIDDVILAKEVHPDQIPVFVERVTPVREAFYIEYDAPKELDDTFRKRYSDFVNRCKSEIDVKVEGMVSGFAVVAYPADEDPHQVLLKIEEISDEFGLNAMLAVAEDEEED